MMRTYEGARVVVLGVALALSGACAADSGNEDTGAEGTTGSGTTAGTTATTAATTAGSATSTTNSTTNDDGGSTEESSSGPATSVDTGNVETDSGGSTDTGTMGVTVSGTVRRTDAAVIQNGNDGIGTLYLGVLEACDQNAASVTGNGIPNIDVSDTANAPVWMIPNVPDGHWFIAAFLDDNGNADPMDPSADMGDLAAAEGFGPACLEIDVAGMDVGAGQVELNIAVPF